MKMACGVWLKFATYRTKLKLDFLATFDTIGFSHGINSPKINVVGQTPVDA
jgi:hypothetical protein